MKNSKNILIVLCVFVAILIIVLLFTKSNNSIAQPQQEISTITNSIDIEQKIKCTDIGKSFLVKEKQSNKERGINADIFNEEYIFNTSLNTCLVYYESSEIEEGTTYNIFDTLKNKNLFQYIEFKNPSGALEKLFIENCKIENGCYINKNDFISKFKELFK